MFRFVKVRSSLDCQQGQVLAEAIVVLLLLVVLLLAVHISARLQYNWLGQWIDSQIAGDAVSLGHTNLPHSATLLRRDRHRWHQSSMQEFSVGHSRWNVIATKGKFAQTAWRLAGPGQASTTKAVAERIDGAPRLWRKTELSSKAVVYALLPTIKAVEAPWESRGSETDWLDKWREQVPPAYLQSASP